MAKENRFTLPYAAATGMMLASLNELKDISLKVKLFGWKHTKTQQPTDKVAQVICTDMPIV